jgi:hypothetical protein
MHRPCSLLLPIVASLLLSTGCATIFTSEKQDIKLRAYPQDATVSIDNKETVGTNAVVPLSRDEQHFIEVSKSGMGSKRVQVKQGLNPWFFVNILWGPFFWAGMLVDAMTGRINELEPSDITINLEAGNIVQSGSGIGTGLGGPSMDPSKNTSSSSSANKTTPTKPAGPAVGDPVGNTKPAVNITASGSSTERPKVPRTQISAAQKEWVVAVMNVETSGKTPFDKNTLLALTDQVRVFLAERGARVVDRSTQDQALKGMVDEEKKKSYQACVDSSCQIPLGKALAASHILRSTVAKFGKACATNGELIDLRSEVTVAAGSARSDCEEEALLYAAETLAEQLIAGSSKK